MRKFLEMVPDIIFLDFSLSLLNVSKQLVTQYELFIILLKISNSR